MYRIPMVTDDNNFDAVYEAIEVSLDVGMETFHDETLARLVANWEAGSDILGNAWEPLDPATIRAKGHDSILVDSGRLLADVQAHSVYDADTHTSTFTTDLAYGVVHELGMPERGIPRRPFLAPIGRYALSRGLDVVESELDDALEDAEL